MKSVNSNIPKECEDLLGETFEVYANQGTKIAQSLNKVNGSYVMLEFHQGDFSRRTDMSMIRDPYVALNFVLYLHAEINFDDQGQVSFLPKLYNPSRYPTRDIDDIDSFVCDDGEERKTWGIADAGNNLAHVFYQNNRTNNRLVYNLVDTRSVTLNDRIQKQVSKGYVSDGTHEFNCSDRHLKALLPF